MRKESSLGSMRDVCPCCTSTGKQHQKVDETWADVYQSDAQRRAGENDCDLKQDFPELDAIASDDTHPSNPDAKLFKGILTRSIDRTRRRRSMAT